MNCAAARRSGSIVISSAFGTSIPGDKESDFGVLNSQNLLRITELKGGITGISLRAAVQARMVLALLVRLTKRDHPSILYDASQSVFSGDGLLSESVNEDELHAMPLERKRKLR